MRKRAAIESHRCTLHRTVIVPAHNLTFVCCGTAHGVRVSPATCNSTSVQGFMTRSRAPTGVLALVAWLAFVVPCMHGIHAQETGSIVRQPGSAMRFDLPAQPLAKSLQDFARLTELIVLAPAPLLDGRTSAPVQANSRRARARADAGRNGVACGILAPGRSDHRRAAGRRAGARDGRHAGGCGLADRRDRRFRRSARVRGPAAGASDRCAVRAAGAVPGSYRLVAQVRIDNRGRWWRSTWWHRAVRPPATRR